MLSNLSHQLCDITLKKVEIKSSLKDVYSSEIFRVEIFTLHFPPNKLMSYKRVKCLPIISMIIFMSPEHYHVFRVMCLELGEQAMKVTVGNKPSSKNRHPSVATATVRFLCTTPVRLQLVPVIRQPNLQMPCPISLDSDNQVT